MKTNGNLNAYDRNSTAYGVYFTADSEYMLIFVKNPHSIHIINVKSGEIFVVRGLDEMMSARIISVAIQPVS
jgi:hypothetical protein